MEVSVYERYLLQMVEYRTKQNASKGYPAAYGEYAQKIQILRHQAIMENVDIYTLEMDTYRRLYKKEPYEGWINDANTYIQEAYLTKAMIDLRSRYEKAPAIERPKIHNEAQQIRMKIIAMGIEPYQFEDRVWLLYRGKAMTAEEKQVQYAHMSSARDDLAKLDAAKKKALATAPIASWEKKRPNIAKMNLENRYSETYSGADMVVFMAFPGYKPIEIGVASVVSYSIYREKKQIRTIGRVSSKGITKGPRTISGRLIFTVIREHVVEMLRKEIPYLRDIKTLLMDELPPFDILVSFGNEYGGSAGLVIQGITVVDEQKTLSIEDLFTENIFTYLARGLEPMRNLFTQKGMPYEPLKWFTSSFRRAGSEILGNFKPKETQLFHDAQILTAPTPFYGAVAGWDSSKYNLDIGIPIGGSTGGGSGGGSGGEQTYDGPAADKPGATDNRLMVQPSFFNMKYSEWEVAPGKLTISLNGKVVATKTTTTYKPGGLAPFKGHLAVKAPKQQLFPLAYSGGNIHCGWFPEIDWKAGDTIKIDYTDPGKMFESASQTFTVRDDQAFIQLTVKGVGSTIVQNTPTQFRYKNYTGGKNVHLYYYEIPSKKTNHGTTSSGPTIKHIDTPTENLPDRINLRVEDYVGGLNEWPVRWTWTLDLSACDRTDNAWDWTDGDQVKKVQAINETNGLTSAAVAMATGVGRGSLLTTSIGDGLITFNPNDFFYTISDKYPAKTSGSRYKLYWEDLPEKAILAFHCQTYKTKESTLTGNQFGLISIRFQKKASNISNSSNGYWKIIK